MLMKYYPFWEAEAAENGKLNDHEPPEIEVILHLTNIFADAYIFGHSGAHRYEHYGVSIVIHHPTKKEDAIKDFMKKLKENGMEFADSLSSDTEKLFYYPSIKDNMTYHIRSSGIASIIKDTGFLYSITGDQEAVERLLNILE